MSNSEVSCEYQNGDWRCYRTPDGRTHVLVGCSHRSPREATRHAKQLTDRARGGTDDPDAFDDF